MLAVIGEAAAYSVVFQRCFQEGLAQALSLLAPVFVAAVALVEADGAGPEAAAVVDCELYTVYLHDLPVTYRLVVNDPEPVVLLQTEEIHSPGINVGKVDNQQR